MVDEREWAGTAGEVSEVNIENALEQIRHRGKRYFGGRMSGRYGGNVLLYGYSDGEIDGIIGRFEEECPEFNAVKLDATRLKIVKYAGVKPEGYLIDFGDGSGRQLIGPDMFEGMLNAEEPMLLFTVGYDISDENEGIVENEGMKALIRENTVLFIRNMEKMGNGGYRRKLLDFIRVSTDSDLLFSVVAVGETDNRTMRLIRVDDGKDQFMMLSPERNA